MLAVVLVPEPGRDLIVGLIQCRRRTSHEDLIQHLGHLARVPVTNAIDPHAGGRLGLVEARDPGRRRSQEVLLARDHENGVHPFAGMKLDDLVAHSAFAGIHHFFEFGDDRVGRPVTDRIDPDQLAAHPVGVEAQRGFDRPHAAPDLSPVPAAGCARCPHEPSPSWWQSCPAT